jgi:hypothetical protein
LVRLRNRLRIRIQTAGTFSILTKKCSVAAYEVKLMMLKFGRLRMLWLLKKPLENPHPNSRPISILTK